MKQSFAVFMGLFLLVVLAGCTRPIGNFSVISTAPPNFANMDTVPLTKNVEADDSRLWFLFIPLDNEPTLQTAVERALEDGNGDFIRNARVNRTGWSILLFSFGAYTVHGDVGNSKALPVTRESTIIIEER